MTKNNGTVFIADSLVNQSYTYERYIQTGNTDSELRRYYAALGQIIPTTSKFIYVKGATEALFVIVSGIQTLRNTPINVSTTLSPYYGAYQDTVYAAKGDFIDPKNVKNWSSITLQILTSPNNPDGKISSPYPGSLYTVIDRVYDYPHFTGNFDASVNGDYLNKVDMFYDSVTKSAGMPALRHGWIVLHNATTTHSALYNAMTRFISATSYGPTGISQQIFSQFITFQLENNFLFFKSLYQILLHRQNEIRSIIPEKYWLSVTSNVPYFYVHIPITIFSSHNITAREGDSFGDTNDKTRFMIMPHQSDWDLFIQRLNFIFSSESIEELIEEHKEMAKLRVDIEDIISNQVDFSRLESSNLSPFAARCILQRNTSKNLPSSLIPILQNLAFKRVGC